MRPVWKQVLTILAIASVFALQALWFILPRQGSTMGESYRNTSRIAALKEHAEHPSEATKLAMEKELSLLSEHTARRQKIIFLVCLVADAGLVWFYWRFWNRRGCNGVGSKQLT
jgi:hypothetical protein